MKFESTVAYHPPFPTIRIDVTAPPREHVDGLVREWVLAKSLYGVMEGCMVLAGMVLRPDEEHQGNDEINESAAMRTQLRPASSLAGIFELAAMM